MSFIKASTKRGEYKRDVNATDAALDKGGNRKYVSIYVELHYEFIVSVIDNMYRFDAINWGVTLGQIRKKNRNESASI